MIEIIPREKRSEQPLKGEKVLQHPDMLRANRWVLENYEPPERELAIFVPCSIKKPYSESPSHKIFSRIIYGLLEPDRVHVVVFGTCGIVPKELEREYPFAHYDFMLGKASKKVKEEFVKKEKERLKLYLSKTKKHYRKRIAYCLGDFRRAMELAAGESGVEVKILPDEKTLAQNILQDRSFQYGSLSQREYLEDFASGIAGVMGLPWPELGTIPGVSKDEHDVFILQ